MVISDVCMSFISNKTIFTKHCLTQCISKPPGSVEIHCQRQCREIVRVWWAYWTQLFTRPRQFSQVSGMANNPNFLHCTILRCGNNAASFLTNSHIRHFIAHPWRERYGVSFLVSASDLYFATMTAVPRVISFVILDRRCRHLQILWYIFKRTLAFPQKSVLIPGLWSSKLMLRVTICHWNDFDAYEVCNAKINVSFVVCLTIITVTS